MPIDDMLCGLKTALENFEAHKNCNTLDAVFRVLRTIEQFCENMEASNEPR